MSVRCGKVWSTPHLRIVLVGGRNSGKSLVGNMILGTEEFVTKERTTCSRRIGEVAGLWMRVVDTPGWWCDFTAQDTPQLVKREIARSVSLCLPGPHVFLVVVKASSVFSEKRRTAVEEHLALLGEKVWSHCLVLLTLSDWPKNTPVEQDIKRGGGPLQWLVEKCSHRYHTINFKSQLDGAQVTKLFEKMQRLVLENGGRHFEQEEQILQEVMEKKREVEHMAQKRFMKVKRRRSLIQRESQHLSDIRLVLLGARGSGKTSAGNTIMGRGGCFEARRTARCEMKAGGVSGRRVTVVDTPGWWMNYFSRDSPAFDKREVVRSVSLCPPGPQALLLLVRVDRAFTETYRRAVQEHLELSGPDVWVHVMVVFSFGDWLGETTIEQYMESEGEPLQWLVEKCGNRYHVLNNKSNGNGYQVAELMRKIKELVAGNGGGHYELEEDVLQELKEQMRTEEERAAERLMRTQRQRTSARSSLGELHCPSELRLVLTGARNTGKSSAGNTLLGREQFDVGSQTTDCVIGQGHIRGQSVIVLDTPGCLPAGPDFLESSPADRVTVFLVVVNISSSFTLSHWRTVENQLERFGEKVYSRAVVVFTFGDWLGDTTVEQRIESEGKDLQSLVDRCRNRYHVLDNKNWGTGGQVSDLLNRIEEMLVTERLDNLQRGDQIRNSISVKQEPQLNLMLLQRNVVDVPTINPDGSSFDLCEVSSSEVLPIPIQSEVPDVYGQVVALSGATVKSAGPGHLFMDREGFMTCLVRLFKGTRTLTRGTGDRQTLVVNFSEWLPAGCDLNYMKRNGNDPGSLFSPEHPSGLAVIPTEQVRAEDRMLLGRKEDVADVHSLAHPRLRDRAVREIARLGGLQALIDQWGNSDLEELESFIDSYFETVLEESMRSVVTEEDSLSDHGPRKNDPLDEPKEEVLSSIDRKLSKLDILEDVQRELLELKQSLESCWRIIQEISDKRTAAQGPVLPYDSGEADENKR